MTALLMFDLDQTLIKGHGAGRTAMDRATREICGVTGSTALTPTRNVSSMPRRRFPPGTTSL